MRRPNLCLTTVPEQQRLFNLNNKRLLLAIGRKVHSTCSLVQWVLFFSSCCLLRILPIILFYFFRRGRSLTFRYTHLNRRKIRHMRSVCLILHLFKIYVEKRYKHSNGLIWFICFPHEQIIVCRQAIACAAPHSEGSGFVLVTSQFRRLSSFHGELSCTCTWPHLNYPVPPFLIRLSSCEK